MADNSAAILPSRPALGTRIVRGAVSSFLISVLSNIFFIIGGLIIPRALSRDDYAHFTVSISFVALVALLADLGMNPFFTRAFAQAEEGVKAGEKDIRGSLLGSALALRLLMSAGVAFLVLAIGHQLYSSGMVSNMSILLLTLIISSRLLIVRSVGEAVLRSEGKYYLVTTFALVDAVAFALLLFFSQRGGLQLEEVIWIYTLCNLPGFLLLTVTIVSWVRKNQLRLSVDPKLIQSILRASVPLMLGTAFLTIHTQIDSLLLDKLSTPFEVSNYAATVRLFSVFAPISLALAAVTAPELTRLIHRNDFARSRRLTDVSIRILLVLAAAIGIVLTFLSGDVVHLLLGEKYASAISLLSWTGWMLLPLFVATLFTESNIAAGEYWMTTTYAGILMVTVIFFDILLIPAYGAAGAMGSKLIALLLGFGALMWLARKSAYVDAKRASLGFLRIIACVVPAMILAAALTRLMLNHWLITVIALAVYIGMVHFTRVLSLHEVLDLSRRFRLGASKPSEL